MIVILDIGQTYGRRPPINLYGRRHFLILYGGSKLEIPRVLPLFYNPRVELPYIDGYSYEGLIIHVYLENGDYLLECESYLFLLLI